MLSKNKRIMVTIFGLIIIGVLALGFQSWWALVGILPLVVAIIGFCPSLLLFESLLH